MLKEKQPTFDLWFNLKLDKFYLLPKQHIAPIGGDKLTNMAEQIKYVTFQHIEQYACTQQEAQAHLRQQWDDALNKAKDAWQQLFEFSKMTGTAQDEAALKDSLLQGFKAAGSNIEQAFDISKNIVEQIQDAVRKGNPNGDTEQQEVFKKLFGNIPQVLRYFEEDTLKAAAKNPEVWAKELYQKMFGEQEQKKAAQLKERLKNEIRDSIAENLRKAGIKPSVDFDK